MLQHDRNRFCIVQIDGPEEKVVFANESFWRPAADSINLMSLRQVFFRQCFSNACTDTSNENLSHVLCVLLKNCRTARNIWHPVVVCGCPQCAPPPRARRFPQTA